MHCFQDMLLSHSFKESMKKTVLKLLFLVGLFHCTSLSCHVYFSWSSSFKLRWLAITCLLQALQSRGKWKWTWNFLVLNLLLVAGFDARIRLYMLSILFFSCLGVCSTEKWGLSESYLEEETFLLLWFPSGRIVTFDFSFWAFSFPLGCIKRELIFPSASYASFDFEVGLGSLLTASDSLRQG